VSRIGKQPIAVPPGVSVIVDKDFIYIEGLKGKLKQAKLADITVTVKDNQLQVNRQNETAITRAKHGLMRSLLKNMIAGVSQGYDIKLELSGVGYRSQLSGTDLKMNLGLSHDVIYKIPEGVSLSVDQNIITVSGADKQKVGQVAAEIRAFKKPEPYKGKGISYEGEQIIRKSGKSGKEATAA